MSLKVCELPLPSYHCTDHSQLSQSSIFHSVRLIGCILYGMRFTFSHWIYIMPSKSIHILHKIIIHALYAIWDYFILSLIEQNRHLTFRMNFNVCDSRMCDGFIITNQSQTPKLYCACLSCALVCVFMCVVHWLVHTKRSTHLAHKNTLGEPLFCTHTHCVCRAGFSDFYRASPLICFAQHNVLQQNTSSSSSICHGVGPLVDPFWSHVSRSLFKGLPWFLLPVGE
jgi:hypothetical protein